MNDSGIGLLWFLTQRKSEKLARLDEEIKSVKERLAPTNNSVEYKECSKALLKSLEKEERDQKTKKRKKYMRDKEDYQSGFVFAWQKKLASEKEGDMVMDTQPQDSAVGRVEPNSILTQIRRDSHYSPRRDAPQNKMNNKAKAKLPKRGHVQPYLGTPSRGPMGYNNSGHNNHSQYQREIPPSPWVDYPVRQGPPNYQSGYNQPYPIHYSGEGRDYSLNIPTQNRFFPLSDSEAPGAFDHDEGRYGYRGDGGKPEPHYPNYQEGRQVQPRTNQYSRPPSDRGNQNWGFPRSSQGLKSPVE